MRRHLLIGIQLAAISTCLTASSARADITFLNNIRRSFRSPAGVAVSPTGDVFVTDLSGESVQRLNAEGGAIRNFFADSPRDVIVSPTFAQVPSGFSRPLFVVERDNNRIRRLSDTGTTQLDFGSLGSDAGQFNQPLGVGINLAGDVFVADTGNNRIQRFSADGVFQSTFGAAGSASGQFNAPSDVAVGPRGEIFVADRNNDRVQKFDDGGNFEFSLGGFDDPTSITVSTAGQLYVVDRDNHRVQRFGLDGAFQASFGSQGSGDGEFETPLGIAVGSTGLVYVADSENDRVPRFFDSDAWVMGRNEFINASTGPIDVGVGSPDLFSTELFRRVSLGTSYELDELKELVVGRNTRLAVDGTLTLSGGALITNTLQVEGLLHFQSGRLEIQQQGISLGGAGPFGDLLGVGANSIVRLGDALIVGAARDSRLSITNGGVVENTAGRIAAAADTVSSVVVDGFASRWTNSSALSVGETGRGGLSILDGGRVMASSASLGTTAGGEGTVLVAGFDSRLVISGDLAVAAAGDGLLSMERGGRVQNVSATIGSAAGVGTVVLEGPGSSWHSSGNMTVGGASSTGGSGLLSIGPFARTSIDQNLTIVDRGTVQVEGTLEADGTTDIQSGGLLRLRGGAIVGNDVSIQGGATFDIDGGHLTLVDDLQNAGEIQLTGGSAEINAARILNAGLMRGGGRFNATLENSTPGEIRLDVGDRIVGSGTANQNQGRISLQNAEIELTGSFENTATGFVNGRGTLRADGGIANRGLMTFSGGQTDVRGDFLNAGASALVLSTGGGTTTFFGPVSSQGGEIRVSIGSSVVFLGTFNAGTTGLGTSVVEGVLSPGNSPARVTFDGDLILTPRSRTILELGGVTAGDDYDQILVQGTVVLDGTAHLRTIDDYTGPAERGQIEEFLLLRSEGGRAGVFSSILYNDVPVTPLITLDDDTFRSHAGNGLFRTIDYSRQAFRLTEYLALAGDVDGDFSVTFPDFLILSTNFGGQGDWTAGDFDGNGFIQFSDFLLLSENFAKTATQMAAAVPEPSGLATVLCGALAVALCRGCQRKP